MDAARIIELLNQEPEMNPDAHDGSYELMREIIKSYSTINNYEAIDFYDLNAIYGMALGTWKLNVEKKKEYVNRGHLSNEEKERLVNVIDHVWNNACWNKYSNREGNKPSIGMFGTGFYSFEGMADNRSCQRFIKLMVDISTLDDDDQIYDLCSRVFDSTFSGMQAAAASVMLHCLKPNTFPILNANYGDGTVYGPLGINLDRPGKISTYISNCRKIKAFRDEKLIIKNYRILDCFPRKHKLIETDRYSPTLEEYDPGITSQQYYEIFKDESIVSKKTLDTVYYIFDIGGEATCSTLASKYGNAPQHYNSNATYLAKLVQRETKCPLDKRDDRGNWYWPVLFQGRYTEKGEQGVYSWKLRQPVHEAISRLVDEGFFDDFIPEETANMESTINKNTILYGPPGTGKTFNTVLYAVAIVEKKSFQEIQEEAASDYKAVKERFEEYKNQGRIAFTTFHQSYGYEEFIEGIRPVIDGNDSELEYSIEDGVFKDFCKKAAVPVKSKNKKDLGLNSDPYIWKVSLYGTYDNPIRQECMENNHIRIGFSDYSEDLVEEEENGVKISAQLNAFYNKMEIGDVVLSCYTNETIDAVGVITGDVEYHKEYDSYNRLRNVKWLVKGINENIVSINGGSKMVQATVYQMKVNLSDVLAIVDKYSDRNESISNYEDNYVFVIDEINRGNISKIFGELITLVEESKRIGAPEELKVKLPYSHQQFGVPKNIYILGTMNTADRSIAIMDTALRRRFSFVEMLPDSAVLRQFGNPTVFDNGISVNVADMLDIINDRITFLYDREHTIGHAFFMPLKDSPSVEILAQIFEKSIIPLLQEYFYEDYAKIQLVLGDDGKTGDNKQYQFISDEEMDANKLFETVQELDSEKKYSINYRAFRKIESYKLISKKL